MDWLVVILSIVAIVITYNIFEKSGYAAGLVFKIAFLVTMYAINGTFKELLASGTTVFIVALVVILILQAILTSVEYFAYNRTNSLFGFFVLSIVLEAITLYLLRVLVTVTLVTILLK